MIKSGGIVRAARLELGLSRQKFGILIAEKVGRLSPYSPQMIYTWEKGIKMPRFSVREACAEDAARLCIKKLEKSIGRRFKECEIVTMIALITESQS